MSQPARPLLSAAVAIALLAVVFVLYWPVTSYELVWDDPIVLNQQINAFHSARDVIVPPPNIPQFGVHYYRPTIVASYLLDRSLFKEDGPGRRLATAFRPDLDPQAFGYHLGVLFWHALATLLVFALGLRLLRGPAGEPGPLWPPALGALLFAVHPVHTESVAWMTGRSDTVCAVFVLGALLLHLRGREGLERPGAPTGIGLASACAVMAVALALLLPGADGGWMMSVLLMLALAGLCGVIVWQTRSGAWNSVALYGPASVLLLLAAGSKETTLGFVFLLPAIELIRVLAAPAGGTEPVTADAEGAVEEPAEPAGRRGKKGRKARRAVESANGRAARRRNERAPGGRLVRLLAAVPSFLPYAIVLGVYLVLRYQARVTLIPRAVGPPSLGAAIRDLLGSIGWFLREMVWPLFAAFIAGIPGGWIGVLVGVAAIPGFFLALRWLLRRGWSSEALLLAVFAAFSVPSLLIVFKRVSETILAERYLYIPSAGGLLLLAFLLRRGIAALRQRGVAPVGAAAAACVLALPVAGLWTAGTRGRIPVWSEDEAFWRAAVAGAPESGLPAMHLGKTLATKAEIEFRQAETLEGLIGPPRDAPPTAEEEEQASRYRERAEALEAEAYTWYDRAWQTYDDNEGRRITANNKGNLYQARAQRAMRRAETTQGEERRRWVRESLEAFDEARDQFIRAITVTPEYSKAQYNWGNCELAQANLARLTGEVEEYLAHLQAGIQHLEKAIVLDQRYFLAYYQLAGRLQERGLYAEAAKNYAEAARWARNEGESSRASQALSVAQQRLASWPKDAASQARRLFEFGEGKRQAGDLMAAVDRYWAALRLDPTLPEAYAGLGALFLSRVPGHLKQDRAAMTLLALRQADAYFQRAAELGEANASLQIARGQFLIDVARYAAARDVLRKATSIGTAEQRAVARKGLAATEEVVARMPATADALFEDRIALGDRQLAEGKLGWAAHAYWQAEHFGHDPVAASEKLGAVQLAEAERLKSAGELHAARESYEGAALDFARAANQDEQRLNSQKGAGLCYLEAGWPGQAVRYLEAAVRLTGGGADRQAMEALLQRARAGSDLRLDR